MFKNALRLAPVVLALVLAVIEARKAAASKQVVSYETVAGSEVVKVPYTREVVKYDRCGTPYRDTEVCYKSVEVPTTKKVPVVKYVKACD